MTIETQVRTLIEKLNMSRPGLLALDTYWAGRQPAAFMSKKSRAAMGGELSHMNVNFPRRAVTALAERLDVSGFRLGGAAEADAGLWGLWRRNRMPDQAAQAHLDALVYGRSYALVWADSAGNPTITVESPLQVTALHDPATRRVTAALKRWTDAEDMGRAVLYTPDRVYRLNGPRTLDVTTFSGTGWTVAESFENPMGVVPVVPIINRGRLTDTDGVSEMRDILGLTDALGKTMQDALVTSEAQARPKRWVTGLEVEEDEDGNPIDPFSDDTLKAWLSESADTKFGQFPGADLTPYANMAATITQQIGALTGLPPHFLGLSGSEPASSDAIYAAEAPLVQHAMEVQRTFGTAWADVMALAIAVRDGSDPLTVDVETVWQDAQTRTPAAAADAAAKLAGIGVPLSELLTEHLGYTSDRAEKIMAAVAQDRVTAQGLDLSKLLGADGDAA